MACQDCKKNPFSPSKKEFWLMMGGSYLIISTLYTTYKVVEYLINLF